MQKIYLDNNATTELDPRVVEAILSELNCGPSNPSSIHRFGKDAKLRLARARDQIAAYFRVHPHELIFTSNGTEALNLAILGAGLQGHLITSGIEHAAVHNTLRKLNNPITHLPIGPEGHINLADLNQAITAETSAIILNAANNETGVKNPLDEIATLAQKHNVPLIVDGVALLGKEPFSIPSGVSAMAFSAHKIHGPTGIGLLFVRKRFSLSPLLIGGGQEQMRRAGTENLPGIIGLAKAIELLNEELPEATVRMEQLRNQFEDELKIHFPDLIINGTGPRICNTSNLTFPGIDGETLLIQLDMQGIAASMGSACSAGALEPSRILLNMGVDRKAALSSLRFSLSRNSTEEEIHQAVKTISQLAKPKALAPSKS